MVQWHLEDIIRNPEIDPEEALAIKRRIDKSNQERTDLVEMIDDYFLQKYANVEYKSGCNHQYGKSGLGHRPSVDLAVKIYHMQQEVERKDASPEHVAKCREKLRILLEQRADLSMAISQLLDEIESGKKYMKVYKQMKMYNDPALNPVLYKK